MKKRFVTLVASACVCLLALAGCDSSSPGYSTHIVPSVAVLSPDVSTDVEQGNYVTIRYIDSCPSGPGYTDLLADRDGDLVTDQDQYAIAWARPAVDGIEQSVEWDTMTMPEGTYYVIARTNDGVVRVTDAASGVVSIRRNPPPDATVRFPPDRCLTDANSITVTGNASDATGVQSVSVNGHVAATDNDFGLWSVVVPLQPGANTLTVRTLDVLGFQDTSAATVLVTRAGASDPTGTGPTLVEPVDLVFDANRDKVYVSDATANLIMCVDVERGTRSVYSDATHYGPALAGPVGLAFDPDLSEIYAGHELDPSEILVVYPDGGRAAVSGPAKGAGDDIFHAVDLALDLDADRLFVAGDSELWEVARTSGDRTELYSGVMIFSVDYDPGSDFLLFSDTDRLWQWTPAGPVEVSGPGQGSGPALQTVIGIDLDPFRSRAFVADAFTFGVSNGALLAVDLASGDRTIVSGQGTGQGPALQTPSRCVYDSGRNVLYVVDYDADAILAVEVDSGDRVVLSR